jgi:hypothetical protein
LAYTHIYVHTHIYFISHIYPHTDLGLHHLLGHLGDLPPGEARLHLAPHLFFVCVLCVCGLVGGRFEGFWRIFFGGNFGFHSRIGGHIYTHTPT